MLTDKMEYMQVKVMTWNAPDACLMYTFKRTQPMRKLMQAYCEHKTLPVPPATIFWSPDGRAIDGALSAEGNLLKWLDVVRAQPPWFREESQKQESEFQEQEAGCYTRSRSRSRSRGRSGDVSQVECKLFPKTRPSQAASAAASSSGDGCQRTLPLPSRTPFPKPLAIWAPRTPPMPQQPKPLALLARPPLFPTLEKIRELKTEAAQCFEDLEDWQDETLLGFKHELDHWLRDVVVLESKIENIGTVYVIGPLGTADFVEVVDEEFGDLQRTWQDLKELYTHVKHAKPVLASDALESERRKGDDEPTEPPVVD